ncbi:two component transcriptional regulator, LytTR family protein [Bacillus methanolicus PB1]|uniref:Two component transcriptional regulator, LytTR family protein n=1 Tax=Bacillus methanolicus PB1 TaxID=997296 RepID=I3E091_BACMT|nr:LytTR family DNA-binding domain-containing protein [Bacillus methanolicus]EIJ79912.1 two component transcriptional regulator, LytTR family protein [Bacillus methanolicus PB1]
MNRFKIIIADDEPSSRLILKHFIQILPDFNVVGEASDGEELIKLTMREKPDIVLADIKMPGLNGLDAVKSCEKVIPSLQVIFTTGYEEFAVEAFNIAATDYIVKPIERTRLFAALEKAKKAILLQQKFASSQTKKFNKLALKSNNSFFYLSIKDILYVEKEKRKTVVHTKDNRYEITQTLKDLERRLPEYIIKTHRSYLVNLKKIVRIESFGETFLAYFSGSEKVAHISKLKIQEVQKLMWYL